MKISQSKIRVNMVKGKPMIGASLKNIVMQKINIPKPGSISPFPPVNVLPQVKKMPKPAPLAASPIKDDFSSLKEAAQAVLRIKLSAQQELEQIRKMRADTFKYQQETATKARSEASQLMLHARLATQREIEELIRQASEEIQKMLADIRVIRITAQEELAAQRKFTDAAKLRSMSLSIKDQFEKPIIKNKRQPVTIK